MPAKKRNCKKRYATTRCAKYKNKKVAGKRVCARKKKVLACPARKKRAAGKRKGPSKAFYALARRLRVTQSAAGWRAALKRASAQMAK